MTSSIAFCLRLNKFFFRIFIQFKNHDSSNRFENILFVKMKIAYIRKQYFCSVIQIVRSKFWQQNRVYGRQKKSRKTRPWTNCQWAKPVYKKGQLYSVPQMVFASFSTRYALRSLLNKFNEQILIFKKKIPLSFEEVYPKRFFISSGKNSMSLQ